MPMASAAASVKAFTPRPWPKVAPFSDPVTKQPVSRWEGADDPRKQSVQCGIARPSHSAETALVSLPTAVREDSEKG